MIPNLYKLAGELIPVVVHLAARQVGTGSTSIYCDHSDIMAIKQTGLCILSSHSVQEAADLAIISHLSALQSSLPFVHTFDGFQTSHSIQSCKLMPYDEIRKLIPFDKIAEFREHALNPTHPHQRGVIVGREEFMQSAESLNKYYDAVPEIVEAEMEKFAAATGRHYRLFEYAGHPEAELVIVVMGSDALSVEETVEYLAAKGEKVGVVRVHLYRPFATKFFVNALPKTTKRIAVLDRCKDTAAVVEPLASDVISALSVEDIDDIKVYSGRYGLADKPLTPAMVVSVFDELKLLKPMKRFSVGVIDDVTHTSLPIHAPISVMDKSIKQCLFWGMGGDGTVGGNQMAIKLIGKEPSLYAQGQFLFTSHKTGGVTISHLRFGPKPIKGIYPITEADFIACHKSSYLSKYPILDNAKEGGIFMLSSQWTTEQLETHVPGSIKRKIAEKKLKFYNINAIKVAQACGLGMHTNTVLQTAFFKLSNVIAIERAIELFKASVRAQFAKKGDKVINANIAAIDKALEELTEVHYDADAWSKAPLTASTAVRTDGESDYVKEFKAPSVEMIGNDVPVSKFLKYFDGGRQPNNTTRQEKRGIAISVPSWDADKCLQCNMCSFVCSHAAIRPFIVTKDEAEKAPKADHYKTLAVKSVPKEKEESLAHLRFRIQVSPLDCSGCKQCVNICPGKCLSMMDIEQATEEQAENFDYTVELPTQEHSVEAGLLSEEKNLGKLNVKTSQLIRPMFEFSGACAGCGETSYIKLLTQLVGERAIIACASGCNVAYSFSFCGNPYTIDKTTKCGPATAHSLFEDTAEFIFGSNKAVTERRNILLSSVEEALKSKEMPAEVVPALTNWKEAAHDAVKSSTAAKELVPVLEKYKDLPLIKALLDRKDLLPKFSFWAIGGDGWSSDIDFGGLDHVLCSGANVKVLVLDTEVYSNTGGQKSKATPMGSVHKFESGGKRTHKKELGQLFMTYKNIYVAQVAIYANQAQALKALVEAEAYDGPAIVIGYAPCIEHGIDGSNWINEVKTAVNSGYWPLYRFNPSNGAGKEFTYDSPKVLTAKVSDVLAHENRFLRLQREHPERAKVLDEELAEHVQKRHEQYLAMSEASKKSD